MPTAFKNTSSLALSPPSPPHGRMPSLAASEHGRTPGRHACLPINPSAASFMSPLGAPTTLGSGSHQAQLGCELWGGLAPLAAPQEMTRVQPLDTCSPHTLPGAGVGAWSQGDVGQRPQAGLATRLQLSRHIRTLYGCCFVTKRR